MFHRKHMQSKQIALFLFVVMTLLATTMSGCGSKYVPSEHVLEVSGSVSQEEALSILNDNISLPIHKAIYEGRRSKHTQIGDGIPVHDGKGNDYHHDSLSVLKFNTDGINFVNFFKLLNYKFENVGGKTYGKYDKERITPTPWKFSKISKIALSDSYGTNSNCKSGEWGLYLKGQTRYEGFFCCAMNEDNVLAAFMKLIPNAEYWTHK